MNTTVFAKRKNLYGVVASINLLTFQIQAPDPPEEITGIIIPQEVDTIVEGPLAEPRPAPGILVKRIFTEGPDRFTAMVAVGRTLTLARQRGSGQDGDPIVSSLVRLDPDSGSITHLPSDGLISVSRLRLLTLPGSKTPSLVALDLGGPFQGTSAPISGDGRIVTVDNEGRVTTIANSLDLPADATSFSFKNRNFFGAITLINGEIIKWDGSEEIELLADCFATPVALATPPVNSGWAGLIYAAEYGSIDQDFDVSVNAGRIVELNLEEKIVKPFLNGITVKAMIFPTAGKYAGDMLVSTANELDPTSGDPISNTAELLRVRPDGTTSTLLFLDDPYDIAATNDGRYFILAEGGIYEISVDDDVQTDAAY